MARLTAKERQELCSSTMQKLSEVIGASGKADELVRLTTQIVQAAKKLSQSAPDALKNRSTATLAEFVMAAKKIAQDPRAVDSASLQKLSSSRKAVEALIKELDAWLTSQETRDETDITLEDILSQTSASNKRSSLLIQSTSGIGGGGGGGTGGFSKELMSAPPSSAAASAGGMRRGSPTDGSLPPGGGGSSSIGGPSELERKLLNELKRQHEQLTRKAEPQAKPSQHGDPEQVLKVAVAGLSRSTAQLMDLAGQKSPASKESLLDPANTLAKMISILMDLVDSLFVSKFPMRSQVHTFTCMLVENVVSYGDQSKSEDTASLRLISTQAPALMSALEVMVEQCYKRSQNIRESQKLSIQRNADLHDLDSFGPGSSPRNSPAVSKKRKEPPTPPVKAVPVPQAKEFEVCVMVCTSVAVDSTTDHLLSKGTEISMKVRPSTTVKGVRSLLAKRTGISQESIQLRYRGDDVLTDDTRMTPDNPLPYFMFNLNEPGEEEMAEFKKEQRRKNRIKIDTTDWSRVPSPVAVAIYDYEALAEPGEEDNLEFEEGDLIEIMEKGGDGWWTGRVEGKVGVFPASFVELIQKPKNKEERKRLIKRFHQGTLGGADITEEEPPERPPEPKFSSSHSSSSHSSQSQTAAATSASSKPLGMTKSSSSQSHSHFSPTGSDTSDSTSGSPTKAPSSSFFSKLSRSSSEYGGGGGEGKHKKRMGLFKKKQHSNDASSPYMPATDDFQRSPILPHRLKEPVTTAATVAATSTRPVIPELEEEMSKIQPKQPPPPSASTGGGGGGGVKGFAVGGPPQGFRPLHRPKSSPRMVSKGGGATHNASAETKAATESTAAAVAQSAAGKKRRPPPPPPPPYSKTHGNRAQAKRHPSSDSADGEDLTHSKTLPLPDTSAGGEKEVERRRRGREEEEEVHSAPISMKVTPASPVMPQHISPDLQAKREEEEEETLGDLLEFRPQGGSMEALLEEFDEFSSTQSLTNCVGKNLKPKSERDYATIPRSELPVQLDSDEEEEEEEEEEGEGKGVNTRPASVPVSVSSPLIMEDRPCLTPSPLLTTNSSPSPTSTAASSSSKAKPDATTATTTATNAPPPIKPPRSHSKRLKLKKQIEAEGVVSVEGSSEQPPKPSSNKPTPTPTPPPSSSSPPKELPAPPPATTAATAPATATSVAAVSPEPNPITTSHPPMLTRAPAPSSSPKPSFRSPKPPSLPPPPLPSSSSSSSSKPSSSSAVPQPLVTPKPSTTPKPQSLSRPLQNGLNQQPKGAEGSSKSPVAPPRKKTRSLKRPMKPPAEGNGVYSLPSKPQVPVKPKLPQVTRTHLEAVDGKPSSSSAPVSRTASPESSGAAAVAGGSSGRLRQESSLSSNNLSASGSSSPATGHRPRSKEHTLSYKTAMKCIAYLSSDHLVREDKLITSTAGNPVLIKRLLNAIDNSEEIDLNSLQEAPSVLGLLLLLYDKRRLGCMISHSLSEGLFGAMQSADPLTEVAGKLEQLDPDYRNMLKKLLRLFGRILKYSDKNNTEMSDIDKVFSPVIFENVSSAQSERLLSYLVSTSDFVIT